MAAGYNKEINIYYIFDNYTKYSPGLASICIFIYNINYYKDYKSLFYVIAINRTYN